MCGRLVAAGPEQCRIRAQALFADGAAQALPGGHSFGGVAQSVLGSEGLASPIACREVFRFDAAGLLNRDFPAARVRFLWCPLLWLFRRLRPSCIVPASLSHP